MIGKVASFAVFLLSVSIWLLTWRTAIGLQNLRHDPYLSVSFFAFGILSFAQVVADLTGANKCEPDEAKATDVLLSITASLLLAISILASLVQVTTEASPIFSHVPFYFSCLAAFLWIVLGVFTLSWLEALERQNGDLLLRVLRSGKRASFFQAVGWSSAAAISLFYIFQRQSGF